MTTNVKPQNIYDLQVEFHVSKKSVDPEIKSLSLLISPWKLGLNRHVNPFYARKNIRWTGRNI
jgi:hypothetical protein